MFVTGTGPALGESAPDWMLKSIVGPNAFAGANGMRFDAAADLWGSFGPWRRDRSDQPSDQRHGAFLATGSRHPISGHLDFDSSGTAYVTEFPHGRVTELQPNGDSRRIYDIFGANGIVVFEDRIIIDQCVEEGRVLEVFRDGAEPRVIVEHAPWSDALDVSADGYVYYPLLKAGEV